jgi:MFS family permease
VLLGSLLGAGFFFQQRRGADPLIPRDAATSSNLRAGTVISFVNTATTSSITVLATLVLQKQLGATPVQAGLALISFSLAVIVGSSVSKPLADRLPARRPAGLGLLIIALGSAFLVLSYGTWWGIVAGAAISGVGLGISSVAGTGIGTSVPADLEGSASGILNTGAQLGTAVGVAALVKRGVPGNDVEQRLK